MIKAEIYSKRLTFFLLIVLMLIVYSNCFAQNAEVDSLQIKPKITFLELGSTTCIPCKQMKPVMAALSQKYGNQIEVIFHDVKKEKQIAATYQIRIIPTQIILNEEGKEIHRHIGFYPEAMIDEFLQKQGLIIINKKGDK